MRVILADDHKIMRAGLRKLLSDQSSLKVVAEAKDGKDLLIKLKTNDWDLVLLDLGMPELNGIEALEIIKKAYPNKKVLVLTLYETEDYLKLAMKNKADGYILKEDAFEELLWAINEIKQGRQAISSKLRKSFGEKAEQGDDAKPLPQILSSREVEVLKLLTKGNTNKQIGSQLGISSRTVEKHRARLMQKLSLDSVAELTQFALEHKII